MTGLPLIPPSISIQLLNIEQSHLVSDKYLANSDESHIISGHILTNPLYVWFVIV